jgi:hypothetical protein
MNLFGIPEGQVTTDHKSQRGKIKNMNRPKGADPDDPPQSKRFIETARQIEAAEDEKEAERAFKNVVKSRPLDRP